jgi:hypothetical protein
VDTVTILRDLWRRRLLVVGVYLIALLAGTAVVFKLPTLESRKYDVGVATAKILVDTPSSQVVEVAPKGSDSLGVRANLLASLMVDGVVKSAIAQRAGLSPNQLVGVTEAATEPGPPPPPPRRDAFVLKTQVLTNTAGDQLPIIQLDAQAPDRTGAAKLANAAVAGLRDYLDSKAALQQIPNADRLQVTGLGAPVASLEVRGPSNVLAIVVVIVVFGLGCACILAAVALGRGWRAASERERVAADDLLLDDAGADDSAQLLFEEEEGEPEPPAPKRGARRGSRREERPIDNWLAASSRPALVVPPPSSDDAVDDDPPQAKTA